MIIIKRNTTVDIIRGILILCIIFYHYTYRFYELYNIRIINFPTLNKWGSMCVGAFFIISGYFLRLSQSKKDYSLKNRLYKLYIPYLICLIIIYTVVNIFGLQNRESSILDFILNILMINGILGTAYVDGAHWYLTYLMLYTIMFYLINKLKNKNIPLGIWLGLNFVLRIIYHFKSIKLFQCLFIVSGGGYIAFVMLGYLLKLKGGEQCNTIELFMILFCLCEILVFSGVIVFAFSLIFTFIFTLILNNKISLKNKFLLSIGNISYELFLIHQNIGYIILLKINQYQNLNIFHVLLVMIFMFIIAYLLNLIINKILKFIENLHIRKKELI